MLLKEMSQINVNLITEKKMLEYKFDQVEDRLEENMMMDEIKKFANEVVPKQRFLFNRYNIESLNDSAALQDYETAS